MLLLAVDTAVMGEIAVIVGAAFLAIGAVLWVGAFALTLDKPITRELAEGALIIGSLLLSVSIFTRYGRLVLPLVLLGITSLLIIAWLGKGAAALFQFLGENENGNDRTDDTSDDDHSETECKSPADEAPRGERQHPLTLEKVSVWHGAFLLLGLAAGAVLSRLLSSRGR